jgi:hypothetical protein
VVHRLRKIEGLDEPTQIGDDSEETPIEMLPDPSLEEAQSA